jgi:hypothetical protein
MTIVASTTTARRLRAPSLGVDGMGIDVLLVV